MRKTGPSRNTAEDFFRGRQVYNGFAGHTDGFKEVAQRASGTDFINRAGAAGQRLHIVAP